MWEYNYSKLVWGVLMSQSFFWSPLWLEWNGIRYWVISACLLADRYINEPPKNPVKASLLSKFHWIYPPNMGYCNAKLRDHILLVVGFLWWFILANFLGWSRVRELNLNVCLYPLWINHCLNCREYFVNC